MKVNPSVRAAVARRSGGICEARVRCEGARAILYHHRKLRSQGGTDTESILLHICNACHVHIHANTGESYESGLLVRSWQDPEIIAPGRQSDHHLPAKVVADAAIPSSAVGDLRPGALSVPSLVQCNTPIRVAAAPGTTPVSPTGRLGTGSFIPRPTGAGSALGPLSPIANGDTGLGRPTP